MFTYKRLKHFGLLAPQAAQDRQAGVLQDRKLPRERGQLARLDAAEHEAALLLGAGGVGFLAALFRRDLGDEIAHLANRRLGFFFGRRFDHVLDLGAGRVHRLELKSWHVWIPCWTGR
jgi:hypothetical protein